MGKDELIEQAQYIFTTSGIVRDHVFKAHAATIKKDFKDTNYHELTLAQHMAVMKIDEHGPLTITCLATLLGVSSPSASAMVEKLVEKKIVTRKQSQKDRRKVIVSIHPETAKKIEGIKQISLGSIIDLVKKVGPKTTHKWCEVLNEIKQVIER